MVADERLKATKRKKNQAGAAIGAAIVGFEQAVFRKLPPPLEAVAHARHDGPVASADGRMYSIVLPDEPLRGVEMYDPFIEGADPAE